MADADNPAIVEGLAAHAVTAADMGADDEGVRAHVLSWLVRLRIVGADSANVAAAAAASISGMPGPELETAEETEQRRPLRELLGVQDPSEELAARLRARTVLQKLSDELRQ